MAILNISFPTTGLIDATPQLLYINTNDTLATVLTAGYLNNIKQEYGNIFTKYQMAFVYTTDQGGVLLQIVISGNNTSLQSSAQSGLVTLPTVANQITYATNTNGDLAATGLASALFNAGDISAGKSGTAGSLVSFPGTASRGSLKIAAANNAGNTITTISNDSFGQATTMGFADPANANGRFLVAAGATPFTSGNLIKASGTAGLCVDAGIVAANSVFNATVTLNQAAVLGAYATPVQLVAAPGAGLALVPIWCTVYTNFQTAAFAGGGVAIVQYDSTVHGAGTNALAATIPSAEITAAASQIYSLAGASATALTAITNKGLFFSNQTGAFTTGNAASTVVITLQYQVITATV